MVPGFITPCVYSASEGGIAGSWDHPALNVLPSHGTRLCHRAQNLREVHEKLLAELKTLLAESKEVIRRSEILPRIASVTSET
jgi:hypothetical protein